ncbi:ATP-binding cassette domain-containing protein [Aliiglaciecola sp. CAU 1673]|uniref:ATP-binding cassette domain-containing protein n=1 Tax=Aliiglaciecola sp. CAU 1673 TaxID=3032595 RepID=UPI0023DAE24A|nr:ATP-binding cassette domain-containing protein [Aliiglaciecola sp. CAU 1673]MDF2179911.1 ATP-binding cassette domain-containing protein [Aliiglaciecola sp. CAU 1673]
MLKVHNAQVKGRVETQQLTARGGEYVHLLGPNGAGKSSLLWMLGGLLAPDSGDVSLNNKPLQDYLADELAAMRALIMQGQQSAFSLTVAECLSFFAPGLYLPEELERTLEIKAFYSRPLNQLSGGEQRRVMIARGLMQIWPVIERGNAFILMDEPVQGLDFYHQHRLCKLLQGLTEIGNLVIVSHHDLNLALHYASRVWLMKEAQIIADGNAVKVLTEATLSNVFACGVRIFEQTEGNRLIQTYLD